MNLTFFRGGVKWFSSRVFVSSPMRSRAEENTLKSLLALSAGSGKASAAALARRLGITMPTVTTMVKKLARKGLVRYERYRPLRLTARGRREALQIIRKHRLVEQFLVEKMRFGWEEVHAIAEQIEHVDAPGLFDRMDELLGHPTFDPHGEPIPDNTGKVVRRAATLLSDCAPGESVRLRGTLDATTELLGCLDQRGLRLGLILKVRSVTPGGGYMVVDMGRKRNQTLSHTLCERLLVEPA